MSQWHGTPESARLSPSQRASLVAYLDGELSKEETEQLDDVLGRSPTARHEVEMLTRTWEMLDALPQPKLPKDFSTRTLERIETDQLQRHLKGQRWLRNGRKAALSVGWLASVAAAACIGFLSLQWWPDRSRALLEDLPLVEELDMYRAVGDIEFLQQMHQQGLFGSNAGTNSDDMAQ